MLCGYLEKGRGCLVGNLVVGPSGSVLCLLVGVIDIAFLVRLFCCGLCCSLLSIV